MNTLRKASLNHFRVVSVSVCVKPTPPHRLDLGVRGRMRRRAKPGGEVAGGDGKADRKGPRGAKERWRRASKVQQGNSGELRVAKAKAVVGRGHSSGEAGQRPWVSPEPKASREASRGAKGLCVKKVTMQIKWREE